MPTGFCRFRFSLRSTAFGISVIALAFGWQRFRVWRLPNYNDDLTGAALHNAYFDLFLWTTPFVAAFSLIAALGFRRAIVKRNDAPSWVAAVCLAYPLLTALDPLYSLLILVFAPVPLIIAGAAAYLGARQRFGLCLAVLVVNAANAFFGYVYVMAADVMFWWF